MRGHECHAIIKAAIEAIVPDFQASVSDRFIFDDDESADEARPHRSCLLLQGQLKPPGTMTGGNSRAAGRLEVYYADTPQIGTIVLSDGEQVMKTLRGLGRAQHQDFYGVVELGDWVPEARDGQLVASIDFVWGYNLTFGGS